MNARPLHSMINETHKFYGIGASTFTWDGYEFEVVEDSQDGYRSSMEDVRIVGPRILTTPIATLTLRESNISCDRDASMPIYNSDDGYVLVDKSGHVWLEFGTDYEDDYYPQFVFNYTPKN